MLNNRVDTVELIRIVDAVANEKSIDKELVLTSMEEAIEKAARTRYGQENNIYVSINRANGQIELGRRLKVVENPANSQNEISLKDAQKIKTDYSCPLNFGRQFSLMTRTNPTSLSGHNLSKRRKKAFQKFSILVINHHISSNAQMTVPMI